MSKYRLWFGAAFQLVKIIHKLYHKQLTTKSLAISIKVSKDRQTGCERGGVIANRVTTQITPLPVLLHNIIVIMLSKLKKFSSDEHLELVINWDY